MFAPFQRLGNSESTTGVGLGLAVSRGLTEDAFDNATKAILNQDFVSGLTQPAKLLDYFPYLAAPPES